MVPPLRCPSIASATSCAKQLQRAAQSRCFSSTPNQEQRVTRNREHFFRWLSSKGQEYRNPLPDKTNYVTMYSKIKDEEEENVTPFPANPQFVSEPILPEEKRNEIWARVMERGESVRDVSVALKVEMRRVGAVVRLMEIEKEWQRIGKPLARPYAQAVASMLPKLKYARDGRILPFESINDIGLHAATSPQIFYPTSESRQFTRVDAARIFDEKLLPADERIPHPEMILTTRDAIAGFTEKEVIERQAARDLEAQNRRAAAERRRAAKLAATVKTVETPRYQFRFTQVNVDDAGRDGRGPKGVGWRYGMPHMDRKRGAVKIPTRVD